MGCFLSAGRGLVHNRCTNLIMTDGCSRTLFVSKIQSQRLAQRLVAMRARRAPATLRTAASQGWARRWWGALAVAVQRATCSAVLGVWTMPPLPAAENDVPLAEVLQFAADTAPSRLPMR